MDDELPYEETNLEKYNLDEILRNVVGKLNIGHDLTHEERLITRQILMTIRKEKEFKLPKSRGRKPGRQRKNLLLQAYGVLEEVERTQKRIKKFY